jgi:hypothetical protein
MKRHTWIVCIVVALFAWVGLGTGLAAVIYPINPQTNLPNTSSNVTLTILKVDGVTDITGDPDQYPIPNQPFLVRLNGGGPIITYLELIDNPSSPLTTSRYPGICTNYDDPNNPVGENLDFAPPAIVPPDRFQLIPKDFGGRAVVRINYNSDLIFAIPQDTNLDGIPDIYEIKYGYAVGGLARDGDIDTGPDASSPMRDGITNIDEYRGFRVGGVYKRGDPKRKDFFVYLEETLQCTTGTIGNFTGQTGLVRLATFYPNGFEPLLYTNVDTLLPDTRVHRLNNEEWVSKFSSWDKTNYVTLSATNPEQDRWINKNSIASNPKKVKGVRIIECLDLSTLSPLGQSDKKPPDLPVTSPSDLATYKDNGNAILYTHRIVKYFLNLITGVNKPSVYWTFENNAWVSKETIGTPPDYANPSVSDLMVVRLMQLVFPWYVAHEALNHAFDVTATPTTTRKASYGYHHADGSGTNVDIKITNTLTTKANNFYIPKYFGISDEREMRVLSSQ